LPKALSEIQNHLQGTRIGFGPRLGIRWLSRFAKPLVAAKIEKRLEEGLVDFRFETAIQQKRHAFHYRGN
jgi:hypothetical protein